MKFSIVTPSFNGLANLKRATGSVRGQSGISVEHIVQDGNSTDGTPEWLATQQDLDARSEPDDGMYDAINRGWSRATGDVLSWLNVDEQYLPGTLASVAETLAANPDVDAVFGNVIMVDPDGRPLAARREIPVRAFYVKNTFLYTLSASLFFRRELWDEGLLRMNSEFLICGDLDLVLRLLAAGKRILHIPRYMALFGVDSNLSVTCADKRDREAAAISGRHGCLPRSLRFIARLGRLTERVMRGCYRTDTIAYPFAIDETPTYRDVGPQRVGFRFTYERALARIARTSDG